MKQNLVSPLKFNNLVAWWDASKITGVSNSTPVSSWPDLSGHGYNATQTASVAYQPIYYTNMKNGLPSINFDGVNDFLTASFNSVVYSQPNTIIGVGRFSSVLEVQYTFDGFDASHRSGLLLNSSQPYFSFINGGTYGCINYVGPIVGQWSMIAACYNGANAWLRTARSFAARGEAGSNGLNGFKLGNSHDNTAPLKGDLCELMIFNRELSYYETYQLETYLAKKWGLQTFAIKAVDNFTRTDSTTTMGNCRSNQTWTAGSYQDANLPTIGISANYARFVSVTGTDSHAWVETGTSNCVITCKIKYDIGGDSDKGILFRRVDANNYWYAHINSANDRLVISRCLAGVRADIASVASATTYPGDDNYWRIFLVDDYISAGAAETQKYVTVIDSNLQTATKHGLYNASGTVGMCSYFAVET